jgi:hypothetical protein
MVNVPPLFCARGVDTLPFYGVALYGESMVNFYYDTFWLSQSL